MSADMHYHSLPGVIECIGVDPGGVYQFVARPHFGVCDGVALFSIVGLAGMSADLCEAYAARCAELLSRHGLTDTPDDISEVTADV